MPEKLIRGLPIGNITRHVEKYHAGQQSTTTGPVFQHRENIQSHMEKGHGGSVDQPGGTPSHTHEQVSHLGLLRAGVVFDHVDTHHPEVLDAAKERAYARKPIDYGVLHIAAHAGGQEPPRLRIAAGLPLHDHV